MRPTAGRRRRTPRVRRPPGRRGVCADTAPRSSACPNWSGLTNSVIATNPHRSRAAASSERWPSCRAPIVGTSPTTRPAPRAASHAARNAARSAITSTDRAPPNPRVLAGIDPSRVQRDCRGGVRERNVRGDSARRRGRQRAQVPFDRAGVAPDGRSGQRGLGPERERPVERRPCQRLEQRRSVRDPSRLQDLFREGFDGHQVVGGEDRARMVKRLDDIGKDERARAGVTRQVLAEG